MLLKFKQAQLKDGPYLWKIYKIAMKSHIENIWGWDRLWQKQDFDKNLAQYQTAVIVDDSDKLGYVQWRYDSDKTYINMLILEPKKQSKGLGIKVLTQIANQQSHLPIELKCFKVNQRAYAFYKCNDFNVIDEDECFYVLQKTP